MSLDERLRLRIFELYDGPTTDMISAVRVMASIHKWIKTGEMPEMQEKPSPKLVNSLRDKNP